MKNMEITATFNKLPHIGARIIKSTIGVAICMIIYFIREQLPIGNGMPFYSALAVLWCIQSYNDTSKTKAKQRTLGTIIGAVYGLVFLLFFGLFENISNSVIYFFAAFMIIPIIYTTVLINKRNASYFSCVVFLSIAVTHSIDANPYLFVLDRVLDTVIGIVVAMLLNSIHMPIKNQGNTLYVSGIDSVLISSQETMTPYNKVELNRLIDFGVHFTISTIRTPADLIESMHGINLQLPVIAMDGAVLYDIKENRYLECFPLDGDVCKKAEKIIEEEGFHCFVNALYDNTLHIYYDTDMNEAEKDLFEKLRCSPYRNYTNKKYRINNRNEKVIYIMMLLKKSDAEYIYNKLNEKIGDSSRIVIYPTNEYNDYCRIRIYAKEAEKSNMLKILKERTNAEKIVTFGSIEGEYDVYVHDDGGNSAVKTLKKLCEGKKQQVG